MYPTQPGTDNTNNPGTDDGVLPSTVDGDGIDATVISIVAAKQSDDWHDWNFGLKGRYGLPQDLTFEWRFGTGEVLLGREQSYTFPGEGTYVVSVTARYSTGAVAFVLQLNLEVRQGNQAPVANAGANQSIDENQLVFLYGGGSFDPDSVDLTYQWAQLSGPPVQLLDRTLPTARFVTPLVAQDTPALFALTVSDGQLSAQDQTTVSIVDVIASDSTTPTANAGADQFVLTGDLVRLDGSASQGAVGALYQWTQAFGTPVALSAANTKTASFVAPTISSDTENMVFQLVVTQGTVSDSDEVVVAVSSPGSGSCEVDADGDGVNDCDDGCPNDGGKIAPGQCGCGTADNDADGDGVQDCQDQCPNQADADGDGDGVVNCLDGCPADPGKTAPGVCGCGISDVDTDGDGTPDCAEECPVGSDGDSDGDGVPNCLDACPNDPAKTAPGACGCGVADADSDGDGVPNCTDRCPGTPDVDADGDGKLNCEDGCPNDATKIAPGICGCGVADVDTDGDGTMNCNDGCPNDANKTSPGTCGCGVVDDANGNGTPDCQEGGSCVTSNNTWQNFPMSNQTGVFTVYFDAIPSLANIDGLINLSKGAATSFSQSAVTPRFNMDGKIDAWRASVNWYAADTVVSYVAGTRYQFRVEVDVTRHVYSVYVTPQGSTEKQIARDYGFRATQASVTSLDYWSAWSGTGSLQVCDFVAGNCLVDSDGDGVEDCADGCPSDANKTSPGACGCGVADTDSDNDGVPNCNDECPGTADVDSDGDGVADCVDACPGFDDNADSDGDGEPDGCEPPTLSVSVSNLDFGYTQTGLTFQVWNSGGETLSYSVADNAGWLSLTPTGGTSTGEKDTITASVNRTGLSDGNHQASVTVTPNVGTAITIVASLSVGSVQALPMTAASRTSGVAPLAVFFDAVDVDGWLSGVVQPPLVNGRREYADFHYLWNFGDSNSGVWATNGRSKNEATGYIAAHVFEQPGTYAVTLEVISTTTCTSNTNCPGGACDTRFNLCAYDYSQEVTVQDPEVVFAGKTYYASSSGLDTNSGTSTSAPFKTFSKAMSMLAPNTRILFKRGDTFSASSGVTINMAGPGLIGAYGTCSSPDELGICANNPVVNVAYGTHAFSITGSLTGRDWRICDLKLSAPGSNGDAIRAWGTQRDWLVNKVSINGFTNGILLVAWFSNSPEGSEYRLSTMHDRVTIASTRIQFTDNKSFMGPCRRVAVLGSHFSDSATSHILRISHGPKAVVTGNTLGRSGNGLHALKLHSGPSSSYPETKYFNFSDNKFLGAGPWPVAVGPQDDFSDERVSDGVFERNRFGCDPQTQVSLRIWAKYVTVRNNVFIGNGGGAWLTGIIIAQRGAEPTPVGCRVMHNTFYRGDSATGYWAIEVSSVASATTVQNNLLSVPLVTNVQLVKGGGSAAVIGQNLQVLPTSFLSPGALDLRLSLGSLAIDAGADTTALFDFDGRARVDAVGVPNTGPGTRGYFDIGAYEFVP
jgi:hypothetical protein